MAACVLYQNILKILYCVGSRFPDFCFCDMYQGCAPKFYNNKIFACELCQLSVDFIPAYFYKNRRSLKSLIKESLEVISRLRQINLTVKRDLIRELICK